MRLSTFIKDNIEPIVAEWETFARSLVPVGSMDINELRDHAKGMLLVIAQDLETPQTESEGASKAWGESDTDDTTPDTPAEAHGVGRAGSGFDVGQMVSEYRALRASVIRLWAQAKGPLDGGDMGDLIRFSESVDQALAESTVRFMRELNRTREIFLGILGHDLRTPLGAVITSAHFILEIEDLETIRKLSRAIVSSGGRMNRMVDDLLDFTRGRFGSRIAMERVAVDLKEALSASIEEIEASRPGTEVKLTTSGDLSGEWDGRRLSQVWSNLLGNAVDHGSSATPITVVANGEGHEVVCSVHNRGTAIPEDRMQDIFNPLITDGSGGRDHLGLGLYIANEIVRGHGGWIEVESSAAHGTTFTVRLPRK